MLNTYISEWLLLMLNTYISERLLLMLNTYHFCIAVVNAKHFAYVFAISNGFLRKFCDFTK